MKKTLLTIAATVAIATTAQADVTNPVNEAKTKDYMISSYPLVEMAMACKLDQRFDFLQQVMDISYSKAGATGDSIQKSIVDMWWGAMVFEPELRGDKAMEFAGIVKANFNHPEIVKGCNDFSGQVDSLIDAWSGN